jgi:hypothetical protein
MQQRRINDMTQITQREQPEAPAIVIEELSDMMSWRTDFEDGGERRGLPKDIDDVYESFEDD